MFRRTASKIICLIAIFVLAIAMAPAPAPAQTANPPKGLVQTTDGKMAPAPGYDWVSTDPKDLRVKWVPGSSHPTIKNIVASDKETVFAPAKGFKWLNDDPKDFRVVAVAQQGPTEEQVKTALVKILLAAGANALGRDQANDNIIDSIVRGAIRQGRDELIEGAVKDLFPVLGRLEVAAVRRTISLTLDGQLTPKNWTQSAIKDEVKAQLRQVSPDAADVVGVVDFIASIAQARR